MSSLKARLEEEYGVKDNPKADELFRIAYEYGHSAGEEEVELYYSNLVDLIK
jgi:hypothetical protein